MDLIFSPKNAGKSLLGHTCCQLFVTNKCFDYVVPIKLKEEVLQEVQQFSKDVSGPEYIICDAVVDQKSNNIQIILIDWYNPGGLVGENTVSE